MKKLFLLISFCVFSLGYSQSFKTPNTPAFSILDYEPSSIMRPHSYKELSGDILNSFDENGDLLMNLGLEVTPYWLKSNPTLTREEYINPTVWQSIKQTFTLSAATVKDTLTNSNNLGFGFRTQIIQGKVSENYNKKFEELNQFETASAVVQSVRIVHLPIGALSNIDDVLKTVQDLAIEAGVNQFVIDKVLVIGNQIKNENPSNLSLEDFCFKLAERVDNSTNDLAKEVIELQKKRIGFSLEVASAAKFITTNESDKTFDKLGFWINANNYVSDNDLFTLTARLMTNVKDTLSVNSDIGIGYLKTGNKYNVSIEGMVRWYRMEIPTFDNLNQPITAVEKDFTYRLAAQLSYSFTDNISANISVGKDFDSPLVNGTSYFSIFGLQYSLFDKLNKVIK